MKKCIALLVIVACMLSGCFGEGSWEFQYDQTHVTEVKLVQAQQNGDYTIVKELDISCVDEIYQDISTLSWKRYGTNLSSPRGVFFLFVYDSGEYDVVSYEEPKHGRFDEDGEVRAHNTWIQCDQGAFEAIVSKYQ